MDIVESRGDADDELYHLQEIIEKQDAEIERLRAALEEIAQYWRQEQCSQMAKEALKPHQDT